MIINNLFPKHANQVAKHNIDTIILNERERGEEKEERERERESAKRWVPIVLKFQKLF